MNAKTIAVFASLALVAVLVGLFGARACMSSKQRATARAPVAPDPARATQIDPHAPIVTPIVVDAGAAMPLVALAASPAPRSTPRVPDREARGDDERADPAGPAEETPARAKPAMVDAGAIVVVDAGSGAAAAAAAAAAATATAAGVAPPAAPGALPSAPLKVVYRDELGWLKLVEMRVFLNGKRVVDDNPTDANRPPRGERTLFETRLFPGHHQVRIETTYVGESSGIFDYMDNVRVRMREMTVVEVDETHGAHVLAHAFDRGALEPWEKRPGLKLTTTAK